MDGWLHQLGLEAPPIVLSIVVASAIVLLGTWWFSKPGDERRSLIVLVFGLATVGAVVGFSGGISRTSVVGDIMPAALGLVGAVALYVFGVDRSRGLIAPICAAAFALALGLGYATGAGQRGDNDRRDAWTETCRSTFTNSAILTSADAFARASSTIGAPCARVLADDEARGLDDPAHFDKTYADAYQRLTTAFAPPPQQQPSLQQTSLDTWLPICRDLIVGKLPSDWSQLTAKALADICPMPLAVELQSMVQVDLDQQALSARADQLRSLILASPASARPPN